MLFFSPEWMNRSSDVFPLESSDMRQWHVVLEGSDPFAALQATREAMRTQCESELKTKLIHLRTGYLELYGDDGAQCRPPVTQFPVGSEWVFALNGPGSKPDAEAGPAISVCGQYWLEVKEEKLTGPLDIRKQDAEQTTTLTAFREKLSDALSRGWSERERLEFSGEVEEGKSFAQLFGPKFAFRLEPTEYG